MKFGNVHRVARASLVLLWLPLFAASGGCSATIPIGSDVGGSGGDGGWGQSSTRVGDFRVIYDVDAGNRIVIVRAVLYKGNKTTGEIL